MTERKFTAEYIAEVREALAEGHGSLEASDLPDALHDLDAANAEIALLKREVEVALECHDADRECYAGRWKKLKAYVTEASEAVGTFYEGQIRAFKAVKLKIEELESEGGE